MNYDELEKRLRAASHGLCTENPDHYAPRGITAGDAIRAAEAITRLRARVDLLERTLGRSAEGWENAVDLGIIPPRHRNTATILADEARAILDARP